MNREYYDATVVDQKTQQKVRVRVRIDIDPSAIVERLAASAWNGPKREVTTQNGAIKLKAWKV